MKKYCVIIVTHIKGIQNLPKELFSCCFCFIATIFGNDYSEVTAMNINFLTGSDVGDTACITVPILNDSLVECNEEFLVSLTVVSMRDTVLMGNTVTRVTIVDSSSE